VRVDKDAIAGIRAKVERAHEHFKTLNNEFKPWLQRQPYAIRQEVRANALTTACASGSRNQSRRNGASFSAKPPTTSVVAVAVKGARGGGRRSADTTLTEMLFDTGAVIARLIEAIGHQDEPISMGPLYPRPDGPFADIQPQV
jgi:hypothetical protein